MFYKVIFGMEEDLAVTIMLNIHQNGRGVCGVFSREIAEMKVRDVLECARRYQHPFTNARWNPNEMFSDDLEKLPELCSVSGESAQSRIRYSRTSSAVHY